LAQSQLGDLGSSGSQLVSIAVQLFDNLGNNPVAEAKALQNLSIAYGKLGDYEKATSSFVEKQLKGWSCIKRHPDFGSLL
jgi:hypothetical protein